MQFLDVNPYKAKVVPSHFLINFSLISHLEHYIHMIKHLSD